MSWLLDTDVLSQPAKTHGNARVIDWVGEHQRESYTSTFVIAELTFWVRKADARQNSRLRIWLRKLLDEMVGRIHGFSLSIASVWADQQVELERQGVKMPLADSYIAATAIRYGHTIVTGNDKDYRRPGLKVFNPFKDY
jgi:predicted nucleic acid-binding protein